jgi:2-amino-4-hydroxy-6-hydroxymethyldihydropteridine diphosphokinase
VGATVYLSLGSNLGGRKAQLHAATAQLAKLGRVIKVSSFYETEPLEFAEQPWFLNCVIAIETGMSAQELMAAILRSEKEMGRRRAQKKGPRSIDIDILLFDQAVIESADLTIPHPAMHHRRFVLEPFAEIAPDVLHPIFKKTIRELLHALPEGQEVRKSEVTID